MFTTMVRRVLVLVLIALCLTVSAPAFADGPTPNKEPMVPTSEFTHRKPSPATGTEAIVPGCFDAYESNDTPYQARLIAPGQSQPHRFCAPYDQDFARLSAVGGATYIFSTALLGPNTDTVIELYDAWGTRLAMDDDGGGNWASRLQWQAPYTGVFYLMARQYNPNAFGLQATYTLQLQASVPGVSDSLTINRGCGAGYGIGAPIIMAGRAGSTGFYTLSLSGPQGNRVLWSGFLNAGTTLYINGTVGWPEGWRTLTWSNGQTSVTCSYYAQFGIVSAPNEATDSQPHTDDATKIEVAGDM